MPVAQTIVLRRVLKGGISTNRCLVAHAGSEYGFLRGSWKAAGMGCWVVFGTLLGPEATGPGGWAAAYGLWCVLSGLFVSGFLAASIMRVWFSFCGVLVCGVCGLGLLFENYIVDASIFYKKQFPRIMNLDLSGRLLLWPSGCGGGVRVVFVVLS
ncbi:hypothetical protein [Pseudarthrobacter sp. SSS035]|uniref:hypothetical protein n=1 Tax=Pseudarthrobacter sp. SSS035 TaxID=2931399 RepID=UPI00200DC6A1|nr:hypothetical protein [Pseudarthrobacter sp. SSS035]